MIGKEFSGPTNLLLRYYQRPIDRTTEYGPKIEFDPPIVKVNSQQKLWSGHDVVPSPSELHIIPKDRTVNAEYYRDHILSMTCLDVIEHNGQTGGVTQRSMLDNMSDFVFMQGGAPVHAAKLTQEWLDKDFPKFWRKGEWPGNSPHLNPIENLWSILKARLDEMGQVSTVELLIQNLKLEWQSIEPSILLYLVEGMPNRMKLVIDKQED